MTMLSTMSSTAVEVNNGSYYTTVDSGGGGRVDGGGGEGGGGGGGGSSTLDGFSVSVIEPENTTNPYMLPAYIRTTSMVVCIAVMVLGIIGNLMVPLVVLRGKDMRNSTNIFLVNLSAADLCVLVICAPTVLVEVNAGPQVWPLGRHMCKAVPFVELTVAHASVLTIMAISFERYYAICEPLRAGYVCTKARATFLCLVAWMAAAFCTSPILWMVEYAIEVDEDGYEMAGCSTQADTPWMVGFILTTIIVFFIIPLVILVVLYTVIARHLMANPAISRGPANNLLKYRKQVVMMLATVVVSFFVCLLPFRAFTLWVLVTPPMTIVKLGVERYFSLLYICRIMLYLNSAINPILYNLMSTKFREGFLRLCGMNLGKRRKKRHDTSSSSSRHTTGSAATTRTSTDNSQLSRSYHSHRPTATTNATNINATNINATASIINNPRRQKEESYV